MFREDQINDYIIVVDDDTEVLNNICSDLEKRYKNFLVIGSESADNALSTIEILLKTGYRVPLVISDQKMEKTGEKMKYGTDLLRALTTVYPKTKKGIITAWYDDSKYLLDMIDVRTDFLLRKPWHENKDKIYSQLDSMIKDYFESFDVETRFKRNNEIYVTKEAETQFELESAFKLRYKTYLHEMKYKRLEDLTEDQNKNEMEFDKYDFQPGTRHIVTMKIPPDGSEMQCVGYVRLIQGKCPMEDQFSLDKEREQGIVPIEISRWIVDKEHRNISKIHLSITRMIYHHIATRGFGYCTVNVDFDEKTKSEMGETEYKSKIRRLQSLKNLYLKMGFQEMSEKPFNYSLRGMWLPLKLDVYRAVHNPESLPHADKNLIRLISVPINSSNIFNILKRNYEEIRYGFLKLMGMV